MKTKLIIFLTIICVTIMPAVAFGSVSTIGTDEEIFEITPEEGEGLICNDRDDGKMNNTRAITVSSAYFKSLSTTRALATVQARSTEEGITSTVQLQRYNSSTGKYANVSGATAKKTVNSYIIKHSPEFSVSAAYKYRIKATINDGDEIIIKFAYLE